jgi:hypothetical protein
VTTSEPDELDVPVRPRLVTAAIVLWAIDAVLHLGTGVVLVAFHGTLVDALVKAPNGTKLTADQVSAALRQFEITVIVIGLLAAAFVYLVLNQNRWGRLAILVLAFVDLIALFVGIAVLPVMLATLIGLIGLFLLYLPKSSAYFAALKARV